MARTAPHHQVALAVWPAACPAPPTADAAAIVDASHVASTNASHVASTNASHIPSKRGLAHPTVARRSVGGRT